MQRFKSAGSAQKFLSIPRHPRRLTAASVATSGAPSIIMRTRAPNAIVIEAGAGGGGDLETGAVTDSPSRMSGAALTGANAGASRSAADCRSTAAPRPCARG